MQGGKEARRSRGRREEGTASGEPWEAKKREDENPTARAVRGHCREEGTASGEPWGFVRGLQGGRGRKAGREGKNYL